MLWTSALMAWETPLWDMHLHDAGLWTDPCLMCCLFPIFGALVKIHAIQIVPEIHIFRAFSSGTLVSEKWLAEKSQTILYISGGKCWNHWVKIISVLWCCNQYGIIILSFHGYSLKRMVKHKEGWKKNPENFWKFGKCILQSEPLGTHFICKSWIIMCEFT